MTTMIRREVWHCSGCFSHGVITKSEPDKNRIVFQRDNGFGELVIPSSNALLSIDAAIKAAEEFEDYWSVVVRQLKEERNRREDAANAKT